MSEIQVNGIDELQAKINQLIDSGDKDARKAVTKAVTPLSRAYRSAAPKPNAKRAARRKNGTSMKKAVFKKVGKATRRKPATAKAGFNVGRKRQDNRRAYHAHLPILGTKLRIRKKTGQSTGRVTLASGAALRARIAAAVNAAVPQSERILERELTESIVRDWQS